MVTTQVDRLKVEDRSW